MRNVKKTLSKEAQSLLKVEPTKIYYGSLEKYSKDYNSNELIQIYNQKFIEKLKFEKESMYLIEESKRIEKIINQNKDTIGIKPVIVSIAVMFSILFVSQEAIPWVMSAYIMFMTVAICRIIKNIVSYRKASKNNAKASALMGVSVRFDAECTAIKEVLEMLE